MASRKLVLEVCANGMQSALNAEAEGADRIELCENLEEGGVTPHYELLKLVTEKNSLPVHVLIRPRPGDFIYSEEEFESMKNAIQSAKQLKAAGIVTGILKPGEQSIPSAVLHLFKWHTRSPSLFTARLTS